MTIRDISPGAGVVAFALMLAALVLLAVQPWTPAMPASDVDLGWVLWLHHGFATGAQWGTGVVFTFGPWGFVRQGFDPRTFPLSLLFWIVLGAASLAVPWLTARRRGEGRLIAALLPLAAAGASLFMNGEVTPPLVVLIYVLNSREDESLSRRISIVLAALLGWVSLAKFTWLVLAGAGVCAAFFARALRSRRLGIAELADPIACVASLVAAWLAAGQALSGLPRFVAGGLELTSGYPAAMAFSSVVRHAPAGFALALSLLLACAIAREFETSRWMCAPRALWFAFFAYWIYRSAVVRGDESHGLIAAFTLAAVQFVYLAMRPASAGPCRYERYQWSALAVAATLTLLLVGAYARAGLPLQEKGMAAFARQTAGQSFMRAWSLVCGRLPAELEAEREARFARLREEHPLPALAGRVDVYPDRIAVALAYGMRLASRPLLQSYAAYTPKLAALDARHLEGAAAPDSLLFSAVPIDGRYPLAEDAPSWIQIFARYSPTALLGQFALFERRPNALRVVERPLMRRRVRFGETMWIPPGPGRFLRARIVSQPSTYGKLFGAVVRPGTLFLRIDEYPDLPFRIVPATAADGFILSPFAWDPESFALASGDLPQRLPQVRAVVVEHGDGEAALWEQSVEIEIESIDLVP